MHIGDGDKDADAKQNNMIGQSKAANDSPMTHTYALTYIRTHLDICR